MYTRSSFCDRFACSLDGQNQILALQLHAVGDLQLGDDAGARRLHHHLHFHGGQNDQRLALLDAVALLDADVCAMGIGD